MAILKLELDSSEVGAEPITITRTGGGILITGINAQAEIDDADETPDDSAISEIRARGRKQNASSGAFELVKRLQSRSLGVVAPDIRKEGKLVEPYLRLLTPARRCLTAIGASTRWLRRSTPCSRPSSSATRAPGRASTTSRSPSPSTSTGSTSDALHGEIGPIPPVELETQHRSTTLPEQPAHREFAVSIKPGA